MNILYIIKTIAYASDKSILKCKSIFRVSGDFALREHNLLHLRKESYRKPLASSTNGLFLRAVFAIGHRTLAEAHYQK